MNTIPRWMQTNENYKPQKDKEGFITRSLLSVMSVLSSFRISSDGPSAPREPEKSDAQRDSEIPKTSSLPTTQRSSTVIHHARTGVPAPSAPVKLFMAILMIVLASCSRNMFFTYCLLAILLIHMCTLGSQKLLKVFTAALGASALSALILLPAIFLGSSHTMLTVSLKVFLSVGLLAYMAQTTPWNKITEGLRFYRVPDLLIFTFDITLKYIVILGDICINMLSALKLRSVGKNNTKKDALSGIMGTTFLKSHQMSEEMCGAMACRGFEGEYRKGHRSSLQKPDLMFLFFAVLIVALFIYL